MSCCNHCLDANELFSRKTALRDLKRYRRKGPNKSTRLLLKNLRETGLQEKTLIDIGGGVGAISFEMLSGGLAASVHVDASTGYLETSREAAADRGLDDRIRYLYGDFTEVADTLSSADIVTLDRVICCYPDMAKLVKISARKSRRFVGLVYPRDRWTTRMGIKAGNLWFTLRRLDFRTYLHRPADIDWQLQKQGFRQVFKDHTMIWESVVYERV